MASERFLYDRTQTESITLWMGNQAHLWAKGAQGI